MTQSTSGRSSPRAATSVQTSTPGLAEDSEVKALNVASRRAGVCCPWSEWTEKSCRSFSRDKI
jgi:hypothetical protein